MARLAAGVRDAVNQRPWLFAICVIAAVPRAWLAVTDHSVFWPDEIYQTLEPAHRAAFGYGLYSWEFRDAARSWMLPGVLAGLLRFFALFTDSGLGLAIGIKLVMVAVAVTAVGLTMRYAETLAGRSAAIVAGLFAAFYPPLLVFSHRATPEMVSSALVVGIPLALATGRPKLAGALAGLSFSLRMQTAPIAAVFLGALLARKRLEDARLFVGAGGTVVVLAGLLDWVTWGMPFDSIFNYMAFTLKGGASTFGVEPASYFLTTLWTSTGWMTVVLLVGLAIAARFVPAACLSIVAFVGAHALIPHKEFRFLSPIFPLALALAGAGITWAATKVRIPALATVGFAAACALGSGRKAQGLTNGDLGHNLGTPYAAARVWNFHEEASLLLARAGEQPDVCGVLALGLRAGFTGGYSYLHREVPLLYRQQTCDNDQVANYIVARQGHAVPKSYVRLEQRGDHALYRRPGGCSGFPKDFDYMLEGADDMGLHRARIRQPSVSELDIPAGSSAAAFVHGWSHGEHLECRETRWAIGKTARIAFPLEPTGLPYALTFTAQPYHRATPQRMSVLVNGSRLRDYPMPVGWLGYQAIVPANLLKTGRNEIELRFDNATRAEGNDLRELAALFDRVRLAPVSSSLDIDVGTSDGRAALASGFSGDETIGKRTAVWSVGRESNVEVRIDEGDQSAVLSMTALAYAPIAPVAVSISTNGQNLGVLSFPARWTIANLLIPMGSLRPGTNVFKLSYSKTGIPAALDPGSQDGRDLAVMVDRIALEPLPATRSIDFGTQKGRPHLLSGWSSDEKASGRSVVWSDGAWSSIVFRRPPGGGGYTLAFTLHAYEGSFPQLVELSLNDKPVGAIKPGRTWESHLVTVQAKALVEGVNVLVLKYAKVVRPADYIPGSRDGRALGVRVDEITFAPTK